MEGPLLTGSDPLGFLAAAPFPACRTFPTALSPAPCWLSGTQVLDAHGGQLCTSFCPGRRLVLPGVGSAFPSGPPATTSDFVCPKPPVSPHATSFPPPAAAAAPAAVSSLLDFPNSISDNHLASKHQIARMPTSPSVSKKSPDGIGSFHVFFRSTSYFFSFPF